MNNREYDSSWSNLQEFGASIISPEFSPTEILGDWELRLSGYLYELDDSLWFDEDEDGGIGGVTFSGTAILDNGYDTIEFYFWVTFNIFGNPENSDLFYMMSCDRSLDTENGIEYRINQEETTLDTDAAEEFIENNISEIFDTLYDMVIDNLGTFGY